MTEDCPICHGSRWLMGTTENSLVACECQETRRKAAHIETLYADCGWPEGVRGATTNGMDLSHKDTAHMVDVAKEYSKTLTPPFLYLYSKGNGTGKTRVALTVGRVTIEREKSVWFVYTPEFVTALQAGQFVGSTYFDMMARATNVDLLILDDFGLYNETKWVNVQMDTIIGSRYMHEKATLITSNLSLKDAPPRLQSRLLDASLCQVVTSHAPDYRTLKKRAV